MKLLHFFKQFIPKPAALIGLTLEQASLKLVELAKVGNNYAMRVCHQVILPSACHSFAHPEFPCFLKNALRTVHITTHKVVLALPYSSVLFKTIELDKKLTAQEIAIQVREHAQQYFNYPLAELMMDFELLGDAKHQPGLREVRWVAARRQEVELQISALAKSGLTVVAVEVDAFSLRRAAQFYIRHRYPNAEKTAVIQVYFTHLLLIVLDKDWVIYTRQESYIEDIKTAILKILQLFLSSKAGIDLSLILFSGSGVTKNLLTEMQGQFGLEAAYLDILPLLSPAVTDMASAELAINMGLAMRELT
jgi:Tfp pilus assembly PilM family ATPase